METPRHDIDSMLHAARTSDRRRQVIGLALAIGGLGFAAMHRAYRCYRVRGVSGPFGDCDLGLR